MVLQFPLARIPILFLSTWAHELGHGLGAVFTGGKFIELTVFPNFSGVAQTATVNNFQRIMVILLGLLGPSLLGVLMIVLTRALNWYRISIFILAGLLVMSQIWAADSFTRMALAGGSVVLGGVMADILFGPHWLWGGLIAALSVIILFAGVFFSDKWARRFANGLGHFAGSVTN